MRNLRLARRHSLSNPGHREERIEFPLGFDPLPQVQDGNGARGIVAPVHRRRIQTNYLPCC